MTTSLFRSIPLFLACAALLTAMPAAAQEGRVPLTSVSAVLNAKADDYPVVVTGTIVKKTGDEKYEFKDDTGVIQAEIDDEDLYNIKVEGTRVTLRGTIDIEGSVVEIDVDSLAKVD